MKQLFFGFLFGFLICAASATSGAVAPTSGARSSSAVAPTSGARSSGAVAPVTSKSEMTGKGIGNGLKTLGKALIK